MLRVSRLYLVRMLLIALSFTSVSIALSALPGSALDFWYLYYSPVLIAAMSFGLRGALTGSVLTLLCLTVLLRQVQVLLLLGPHDALLRLWLLAGSARPSMQQLERVITPLIQASEEAARAVSSMDTAGDFATSVARVGLGSLSIVVGACMVGWQVDAQRRSERTAHMEARTDSLTGLANYRSLMERMEVEIAAGRPFSVALIDMDNMKGINDTHGHVAGDRALTHLTTLLQRSVRPEDLVARYGGDEFVVMIAGTEATIAESVANRLLHEASDSPLPLGNGSSLSLHLSVGVVAYNGGDARPAELVAAADAAMYAAKQAGGHQSRFGTPRSAPAVNYFTGQPPSAPRTDPPAPLAR